MSCFWEKQTRDFSASQTEGCEVQLKHSKRKLTFSIQVKVRQPFPLQIHTGTSAPEPSVLATFSSPVAQGLTATGKTEKSGQPDDALIHPHSSDVLPTVSPMLAKSTMKMQTATSVPSGVPTNGSVSTIQTNTAASPSTTATTPGENMQCSSKCHLLRFW